MKKSKDNIIFSLNYIYNKNFLKKFFQINIKFLKNLIFLNYK